MKKYLSSITLYLSLVQSLAATLGSLYASEILHLPPCSLCWYQRIVMYPLVPIITVGILRKDSNLPYYVLPLSITGVAIAFYQVLLQQGIISENLVNCTLGVSCKSTYGVWLGFITIPLLSFLAFSIITVSMLVYRKLRVERI